MNQTTAPDKTTCYHCGEDCKGQPLWHDERTFCCFGCQTVFELLAEKDLCDYYSFENNPGNQLSHFFKDKYIFLDDEEIVQHLLDFKSAELAKITFSIPSIHCSSCIWLLENIRKFDDGILHTKIDFSKKRLAIDYNPAKTSLRKIADLLYQLSYEPEISLDRKTQAPTTNHKTRDLKIGIAGFCFGNIMLLAFPDYLGIELDSEFIAYFTYISLGLSLPVLLYCSSEFFTSAISGLRKRLLNIDLPIAIGILALFGRSLFEIITETGSGYLDSLSALVFFLLIGRWVQNKTYEGLAFDRNFKSYFPLAVQKIIGDNKKSTLVTQLEINDLIEIRNEEIIPCDAVLMSTEALIDYSFVSGESAPNLVTEGAKLYAGGKIKGASAQMTVIKPVSQSYLTQLWNHSSFDEAKSGDTPSLIDQVSRYFTPIVLCIALVAGIYWSFADSSKVLFVVSSVLIVACPCALALAAPFTLSATMNTLGQCKMYLKGTAVIEKLWEIRKIVFDKTGTITTGDNQNIEWHGRTLAPAERAAIMALASQSVHPLSMQLHAHLHRGEPVQTVSGYQEEKSKGLSGIINNQSVKMGSASFVGTTTPASDGAVIAIAINEEVLGYYLIQSKYRTGLKAMIDQLATRFSFAVLSGDNETEKQNLTALFPRHTPLAFNQSPEDKLQAIQAFEYQEKTIMIGDGLNDAGALKASYVGISVAENMSSFTPASDVIIMGNQLTKLPQFLKLVHQSKKIILAGFMVSFGYNIVGLSLAVAGYITPVIAAILMPVSSISVVLLSTLGVKYLSSRLKLKA
ncbi:heavy metal translocating P-type ATPase metal-binding domain-containing protein [Reichenbachiella carrageenanivorans]|uniref:Heavy metal translocating P-type ATPase metal-binding domain-containing protein n=1 Tax=Reichenbachiella carrageenanivorans TaxID=2979869 RepID=A0ABY6CYP7_9BACT|nr:heavy metal translocating P-type ATPase metal-binding domain-containing protein [Reichenbachiella carrageenanivorans]UXX78495.1 heavy metal translocating P-type ATPase metal-binding domain-containing protein [Reichenbachiella carrageenanivorans]